MQSKIKCYAVYAGEQGTLYIMASSMPNAIMRAVQLWQDLNATSSAPVGHTRPPINVTRCELYDTKISNLDDFVERSAQDQRDYIDEMADSV